MIDLLNMSTKATAYNQKAKTREVKVTSNLDPYVDFQELITEIASARRLHEMSQSIGVSRPHLTNLGKGNRRKPSYMIGVKIIQWYDANMRG